MAVEVCRIRSTDAAVLKEIRLAALFESPFAFGSRYEDEAKRTDEAWLAWATRASTGRDRVVFLAWMDGRPGGIAGGYRPDRTTEAIELVSMWTAPEARRSGAGRLLVQAVIDWAIETDTPSVSLWVTRGNTPAQRLYESMGFRETGDYQPLPSDPCKDELRMERALTQERGGGLSPPSGRG
jgi:GNAT superfamily N-acetyltransferase